MSLPESALSSNRPSSAVQTSGWETARRRIGAVLYVLLCIEIGTFLLILPWSAIWDRNLLLNFYPSVRPVYMSAYLRGAISGLGLVNLWLGIAQAWGFKTASARQN